jgi:hypothetical protein
MCSPSSQHSFIASECYAAVPVGHFAKSLTALGYRRGRLLEKGYSEHLQFFASREVAGDLCCVSDLYPGISSPWQWTCLAFRRRLGRGFVECGPLLKLASCGLSCRWIRGWNMESGMDFWVYLQQWGYFLVSISSSMALRNAQQAFFNHVCANSGAK